VEFDAKWPDHIIYILICCLFHDILGSAVYIVSVSDDLELICISWDIAEETFLSQRKDRLMQTTLTETQILILTSGFRRSCHTAECKN
jgi:hypothetical protein